MNNTVDGKKNGTFQICDIDGNYSLNLHGSPSGKQSTTQVLQMHFYMYYQPFQVNSDCTMQQYMKPFKHK